MKNHKEKNVKTLESSVTQRVIFERIKQIVLERENKEQQSTLNEVEDIIQGKELILDNACY